MNGIGPESMKIGTKTNEIAQRNAVEFRYDILDPRFIEMMAVLANYGAEKYGDFNWQKSKLGGEKSPVNHIHQHLVDYQLNREYDHFDGDIRWHLIAIAFNAMMEFYWCSLQKRKGKI